ncbi:Anoctamin-8 [Mactra antiquata]
MFRLSDEDRYTMHHALTLLTRQYGGINTTRLVASSKVLHHAIPTHNCDIIMTLPAKTDDVTLMWILARLRSRSPRIHVYVRHWKNTGMYAFYMTANYENLLKGAEQIGLRKPLRSEYGGGMRKFILEDRACYQGIEDEANFLTSRERQTIVYHFLLNLRACPGEELGKLKFLEGQAIVPFLQSQRIISQVFPLHEQSSITMLRRTWVQKFFSPQPLDKISEYFGVKISMYFAYLGHYTKALVVPTVIGVICWFLQAKNQELEDICFLIFALFNVVWATIYTESWRRRSSEYAYRWGTLDKKAELLQDPRPLYTGDLVTSPVTGRLEPYYSSWKRNLFRYGVTVPVVFICLIIVFMVMLLIFELQEWVNGLVKNGDIPYFCQFVPKVLLAVSIGVLDEIYKKIATWLNDKENYRLDETYENHLIVKLVLFQFVNSFLSLFYIAFYLQDMDRLRDQLATLMITRQVIGNIREAVVPYILWKMRLIQVGYHITGHMSPHTLAKEVRDLTGGNMTDIIKGESPDDTGQGQSQCQEKDEILYTNPSPTESLFTDLCPDESQAILTDTDPDKLTPENTDSVDDVLSENNIKKLSTESGNHGNHSSELTLTQAEIESTMKRYEDTFDDYLEMFIQYGYVILFSSAFPLAALCALLNNVIEIHSDAFKLCVYHQRPFGKRVRNIGIWQDALRVMGVVAVVVNSALIGVSGQMTRMVPDLDMTSIIIVILVIEHLMLVLKMLITYAIPSHPDWITQEMARLEFQRREALKSLETQFGSPLDIHARQSGSPDVNPIFNLKSPPKVPVRHHESDLALLSQSKQNISSKDGRSVTSTQSSPSSSSSSSNISKSSLTSSSTVSKSSKIPINTLSHTPSGEHRLDNDDDNQIHNNVQSSSSNFSDTLLGSTDLSNTCTKSSTTPSSSVNISGIRSSGGGYVVSNPEMRLQTRQRILQSAKSRHMESGVITQRKPTGTS